MTPRTTPDKPQRHAVRTPLHQRASTGLSTAIWFKDDGETWEFIRLCIPTIPAGQPRIKATARNGFARVYTPTTIKQSNGATKTHPASDMKAAIRSELQNNFRGAPVDGPIRVDIVAVFPRPKAMIWKTRPMPRAPHTSKPDRDNLDKAVLDSLSKFVFHDDAQVCQGSIEKWIAAGDEQPHLEITITRAREECSPHWDGYSKTTWYHEGRPIGQAKEATP